MSDATRSIMMDPPQLNLLDKLAAWFSWILAGVIFFNAGWWIMAPDDPLGAVSLLTREGAAAMLIQALLLACVIAAMTTLIAGRKRSDIGAMTAAIGLAVVSFRGRTMEYLLVRETDSAESSLRGLAILLALESIAWFLVILFTLVISGWVMQRRFGSRTADDPGSSGALDRLSVFDVPRFGRLLYEGRPINRTPTMEGLKHTVVVIVVGLIAFLLLSAGLSARAIQHGQVCFVVAASVYIGCYFAYRYVPVYSALWSIMAVGLMAVLSYVTSSLYAPGAHEPAHIPASPFMRVLPIQYVAVGTIAAIAMFLNVPFHVVPSDAHPASFDPSSAHKR